MGKSTKHAAQAPNSLVAFPLTGIHALRNSNIGSNLGDGIISLLSSQLSAPSSTNLAGTSVINASTQWTNHSSWEPPPTRKFNATNLPSSSLAPYQNNTSMRGNCLEPRPLSWCMWRRDIWIASAFLLIFPSPRLKRAPQPKIARKRIKTSAPNALTLLAPHNPASPTPYFFLPSTRNSSFSQHQSFLLPITRYA
ncbi:hypothetical protein L207DRAFT_266893 [Hyaloscypha variabilis F]|uniref:Uncharacterized protein n=1 Tax=Hyaloscypha variabilis (strain UAMH 11265 / GT02V1 / F) TaxID=1149755 RepID=A0A2J6RZE2_HYAVF|nr:hypothetical protein L207DRAFT_266893 [Hyaloscypha variabilis F]